VFLYLVVQQLFLLLTHALFYIDGTNDIVALTLADGPHTHQHSYIHPPLR
jgi:hypothetical protein